MLWYACFLVCLSFVAFLLMYQGYLAKELSRSNEYALAHTAEMLSRVLSHRHALDSDAVRLLSVYLDGLLKGEEEKRRQRIEAEEEAEEEHNVSIPLTPGGSSADPVTIAELQKAKELRKKLDEAYSLARFFEGEKEDVEQIAKLLQEVLGKPDPQITIAFSSPGGES